MTDLTTISPGLPHDAAKHDPTLLVGVLGLCSQTQVLANALDAGCTPEGLRDALDQLIRDATVLGRDLNAVCVARVMV